MIPAATEVGAEACGVATTAVQHAPEIGRTSLLLGSMLTHGRSIPVKPILDVAKQYEVLQEISEGSELESAAERLYPDRKSTRLNSSHVAISYAVFCLKKK